jgi:hypothetical protein
LPITNTYQNTRTISPDARLSPPVRHQAQVSSHENEELNTIESRSPHHQKIKKKIKIRKQASHEKKNPYDPQSTPNPRIHESGTEYAGGSDADPSIGDHEASDRPIPQGGDGAPILPRFRKDLILPEIAKHQEFSRYWEKRRQNDDLAKALGDRFRNLETQHGHHLYLVSLTYKEPKRSLLTPRQATDRLKEFYRTVILPLLVHRKKYHKAQYWHLHPILFAFPDVPGLKKKTATKNRKNSESATGHHHHAVMAVHPDIAAIVDAHCGKDTLCIPPFMDHRKPSLVMTSDLQAIVPETLEYTISYATKWALSQQSRQDDWFTVLPDTTPRPANVSNNTSPDSSRKAKHSPIILQENGESKR